ncbi:O-methyltransferase MdmC-like [Mya arenaria]|uniref:O-methyltransferase MdmC-like n=1 Tax=Mya arenaria TaxID=6604 RepID=UPI0022E159F4|nr:O-methyltransferase MdmC-like [Mya arenaria]
MLSLILDPVIHELNDAAKLCDEKGVDHEIKWKALNFIKARDKYRNNVSSKVGPWQQSNRAHCPFPSSRLTRRGKPMMSGSLGKNGEVVTCEIDPFLEMLAKSFSDKSPHGKKINVKDGTSINTLTTLADERQQFDVVFIDADKPVYIDYFKTVIDSDMLAPGGTVVLDNAFMYGHAYRPESTNENGLAIRVTNEYINSRADLFKVLVPIRDGALIVRRMKDMFVS